MKKIDFIGKKNIFFTISIILILITIISSILFGVNLDIKFTGGSISTYSYEGDIDLENFKTAVKESVNQEFTVRQTENILTNTKSIIISLASKNGISNELQNSLNSRLDKDFEENKIELINSDNVRADIGKEFFLKSIVAVIFAAIIMIMYISFRFKKISGWSAGVVAVIALIHDLIIVFGVFVIFKISINDNFIAVLLTILGYSINDTIVIYDRIRENKKLFGGKLNSKDLVNLSINQSLRRSITTTLTTVVAMLIVSIFATIYGLNSINSFAFPIIIGMISGVYSTIFIAGPLWVLWQDRNSQTSKNKRVKKKTKKLSSL
ncbi:MAG: protein translocase subunit SecF [Oscillospiraceae bacterium]|nr:protein translocase subunit SecF [Oscillospiraceae bacterium]